MNKKKLSERTLTVGSQSYTYYSLESLGIPEIQRLPYSLKVLLENLIRNQDGERIQDEDIRELATWSQHKRSNREICFYPARVLMQDFTGVPAVVDLAALRDAVKNKGGDPSIVNPLLPVDLVIDHSVIVDHYGTPGAFQYNVDLEYKRNEERYQFLSWGQKAFTNFRVVPPGTGICHQVNLEYLAQVVWKKDIEGQNPVIYPDTLVGTDSHTTMVNGLAVLGWGVGGIEAEAAMLGQPLGMIIPEVVGFRLEGRLPEGTTATDLVLTITQMLRKKGVVNKFVEFYGPGIEALSLADRATIANMAPEYGATCGYFPIDDETLYYLKLTGRDPHRIDVVEAYAKAQGLFRTDGAEDPIFTDTLNLDLNDVEPSMAGPKRPHDRIHVSQSEKSFKDNFPESQTATKNLKNGDIVIAAITSCTNTSNPYVMIAAGILARKARHLGLQVPLWVKTSLAPGSQVVTDYLKNSGLQEDLDALGFNLVGYGCTTCIGNSGPLSEFIAEDIEKNKLAVCSILSGNRNFEGRINPHVKANYLASPPLVVAYALAGKINLDILKDPIGKTAKGESIYLKQIWPTHEEIRNILNRYINPALFAKRYKDVFKGDKLWNAIGSEPSINFKWDAKSTYVKKPPYFEMAETFKVQNIKGAHLLALLGDSITTDHISPAGSIKDKSPGGRYLIDHDIFVDNFNSYGSRRGNHELMVRGTFANIRLKNEMVPLTEGGMTVLYPEKKEMSIFDASEEYQKKGNPLIIIAGKEYGSGSSRDWAAKGSYLLGVKAVIAESFERIHRSNLIGMGILPLEFQEGMNRKTLGLKGHETFDILGLEGETFKPKSNLQVVIHGLETGPQTVSVLCRIDTMDEVKYYYKGGILPFVLNNLLNHSNEKDSCKKCG
jgi:aconitate hydratase